MPYKSNEWKSQSSNKKKSTDSDLKIDTPSNNNTKADSGKNTALTKSSSEVQSPPKVKKTKLRRTVTLCRRLLAWTMITWLGYYTFFVCGNHNGPKDLPFQSDICSAIDTVKLDFLSLFETNFYKTNVDPIVLPIKNKATELYLHHGIPAQAKISDIYMQHGKYYVDQSKKNTQHIFKYKVKPVVKQFHSDVVNHPFSQQTSQKLNELYNHQHVQLVLQKSSDAYNSDPVQNTITKVKKMAEPESIKAGWEKMVKQVNYIIEEIDRRLPEPAIKIKNAIKGWIHYAENTDIRVTLNHLYWNIVDFYNGKVVPFMKTSPQVKRARVYYKKNIEGFVNYNIKPTFYSINERWHLDRLYYKLVSYLPNSR